MIKFDYKFLKIYAKIKQKGEENETMVRDHQKCHHVVAAWLSFITPLLLCLALCWFIISKTGVGVWVYIPGFFFGMGGSATVAYKFYLSINRQQRKENKKRKNKVSFNRHL